MNKQIFLKHIGPIEEYLKEKGYTKLPCYKLKTPNYKDHLSLGYINTIVSRQISLSFIEWPEFQISLSMYMYKVPSDDMYFSLQYFLESHKLLDKINRRFLPRDDFEAFVIKYFADLLHLLKNELNDHITGKVFEDHMTLHKKSMEDN